MGSFGQGDGLVEEAVGFVEVSSQEVHPAPHDEGVRLATRVVCVTGQPHGEVEQGDGPGVVGRVAVDRPEVGGRLRHHGR